jgi:hypothetical protein
MKCTHIMVNRGYNHSSNHQEPIGHGNIYLAMESLTRMNHLNMWEVTRPHNLREELEGACNHCLGGHNCCQDGYDERWIEHSRGNTVKKGVTISKPGGIFAYESGLSDIGQEETREGETEPRELNSPD